MYSLKLSEIERVLRGSLLVRLKALNVPSAENVIEDVVTTVVNNQSLLMLIAV
ncbi:MAG: hypothetical protein JW839_10400 [Candidatus Lokiarchaeota archaeon]|nr:hypothetical protein [Candidatus Lokiarchaeota archaeon]